MDAVLRERIERVKGLPYKWGGTSLKEGFDCTGFLFYLFTGKTDVKEYPSTKYIVYEGLKEVKYSERPLESDMIVVYRYEEKGKELGHAVYAERKGDMWIIHEFAGGVGYRNTEVDEKGLMEFINRKKIVRGPYFIDLREYLKIVSKLL